MTLIEDTTGAGARRRFDGLFEEHHRDIVRYCVRRLGIGDGEDAAAEVFAVAWRRLDEVPDGEGTRAWLLGVAYRVVGNQYRSRARRGRLLARLASLSGTLGVGVEAEVADGDEAAVRAALTALRSRDREVLQMVAWDGLSRSEMAGLLGISENAVDQRVFRARARLRDRLSLVGERSIERLEASP